MHWLTTTFHERRALAGRIRELRRKRDYYRIVGDNEEADVYQLIAHVAMRGWRVADNRSKILPNK